ncbi:MAG: hypothetical protein Q9167_003411 [Letrouitia subvulpina]
MRHLWPCKHLSEYLITRCHREDYLEVLMVKSEILSPLSLRPRTHNGVFRLPFQLAFVRERSRPFGQPSQLTSSVLRCLASSSSKRWQSRQERDRFATKAKVQGLKSRAAFKLLEVAIDRISPGGHVLGIDVIPAQPPKGVSTIQGNFLSAAIQDKVKRYLRELKQRPLRSLNTSVEGQSNEETADDESVDMAIDYWERERLSRVINSAPESEEPQIHSEDKVVDVVLSDMSAPWAQTEGFWKRSLSNPYSRMMNASGINFRDHAGSMDLCDAALHFAFDMLRAGGHFVCKFYQGPEDALLERRLKRLFMKVHREKPESSRKVRSSIS